MEINQRDSFYVSCFFNPALKSITKRKFNYNKIYQDDKLKWTIEDFPSFREINNAIEYDELWFYWYYKGYKNTPQLFEKYYKLYIEIENTDPESIKKKEFYYKRIKSLGIEIIPLIMEKLKKKEYDLIPLLDYLTDNAISDKEFETDLDSKQKADIWIEWFENNKKDWTIQFDTNLGFSERIKIIKLETKDK